MLRECRGLSVREAETLLKTVAGRVTGILTEALVERGDCEPERRVPGPKNVHLEFTGLEPLLAGATAAVAAAVAAAMANFICGLPCCPEQLFKLKRVLYAGAATALGCASDALAMEPFAVEGQPMDSVDFIRSK